MPIYEYQCTSCGHKLEVIQKISDAPLTVCEACQQSALEKLVSHSSFQLKGGGWYSDLYSSTSGKSGTSESSSSSSSTSSSSSSSSTSSSSSSSSTSSSASKAA